MRVVKGKESTNAKVRIETNLKNTAELLKKLAITVDKKKQKPD
jgi:hypothetical protein